MNQDLFGLKLDRLPRQSEGSGGSEMVEESDEKSTIDMAGDVRRKFPL